MARQAWEFDAAHSTIGFSVTHMMFAKVRGSFGEWDGQLTYDADEPENSTASVEIDVSSIDTGNNQRDDHLRSADFFDVDDHPAIKFESTSFRGDPENLTVTGNLTIHGVTKEVSLDVEQTGTGTDPWGNRRIGFRVETTLNRKDFDLTWNQALETGGVLVGEDVEVEIEIEAVAQNGEE